MPKGKTTSPFADRIRDANEEHKTDEAKLSSAGDLPAPIDNGEARLVDCKIGYYEKGDN